MSERNVTFTLTAKDDFSATFGKFDKDISGLRKNLNLPLTGPLDRAQQTVENSVVQKVRSMEVAANKARLAQITDEAIFGAKGGKSRFSPAEQATRDAWAKELRSHRGTPDFSDVGEYGSEVARLRGGISPRSSSASAGGGGLNFLKAGLAFAAVATILDRVGQGLEEFDKQVRSGSSKSQAFAAVLEESIPGAKGARQIRDMIFFPTEFKERQLADQRDENKDTMRLAKERRDANRQAILLSGRDVQEAAQDALKSAGLNGTARQNAQINAEYDQRIRALDRQYGEGKGQLSPDQAEEFKRQIGAGKAAALAERNDNIAEMDRARNHQMEEDARQVVKINEDADQRIGDHREAAQKSELELQGQFLKAKIDAVDNSVDKQVKALERQRDEEIRALEADPTIGKNASVIKDNARARFAQEKAALVKESEQEKRQLNELNQREVEDLQRQHHQQMLDAQSNFAARGLQLTGKGLEADRLQIQTHLADRLVEIKTNLDKEVRAHAERAPLLKQQAAEDAEAARRDAELSDKELIAERAERYRTAPGAQISGDTRLLTGVGSQTERGNIGGVSLIDQAKTAKEHKEITKTLLTEIRDYMKVLTTRPLGNVIPAP